MIKNKREIMCTDWCSNAIQAERNAKQRERENELMHEFTYAGDTVNVEHEIMFVLNGAEPFLRS